MDSEVLAKIQQKVNEVHVPFIRSLHEFPGVDPNFIPWESGLSPSALYNCSLGCRKKMGMKTPETKWMSIKRWVSKTPEGITLPDGVYLSIKRREEFQALPSPRLAKTEYILMMFRYGSVWSQQAPDVPITEDWLWSETNGSLVFDSMIKRDAEFPMDGYFQSCQEFMEKNPDQIGIHLKRQKRPSEKCDNE